MLSIKSLSSSFPSSTFVKLVSTVRVTGVVEVVLVVVVLPVRVVLVVVLVLPLTDTSRTMFDLSTQVFPVDSFLSLLM